MTTPKPDSTVDGEADIQLRKIIVGAMERGNMYKGYVASAEFNVEANKVVETYLPMLKTLIATQVAEERRRWTALPTTQNYCPFCKSGPFERLKTHITKRHAQLTGGHNE